MDGIEIKEAEKRNSSGEESRGCFEVKKRNAVKAPTGSWPGASASGTTQSGLWLFPFFCLNGSTCTAF